MDTIIFLFILVTFATMLRANRKVTLGAFFLTLAVTLFLFNHHVTDSLPLNF